MVILKVVYHIQDFDQSRQDTCNIFIIPGSTLDTSFRLLHEAEEKLKTIVNNKFDASVHSGDLASIERFFKIFPLIGLHEEGLTKFGKYLAAQVNYSKMDHLVGVGNGSGCWLCSRLMAKGVLLKVVHLDVDVNVNCMTKVTCSYIVF